MLTRAGVKPTCAGNAEAQIPTELLQISPAESIQSPVRSSTLEDVIQFNSMDEFVGDVSFVEAVVLLSRYTNNVLCYIAGFVVKKLLRVVHCNQRRYSLVCHSSVRQRFSDELCLLKLKTHGGLITASDDVCRITKVCEATLRANVATTDLTHCLKTVTHVQLKCMHALSNISVFDSLKEHAVETRSSDDVDDHVYQLKKEIVKQFMSLCRCHAFREFSTKVAGQSVRKKLTKTVLLNTSNSQLHLCTQCM